MRIQILPLPSVMVGDQMEEPFALVVDQFEWPIDDFTTEKWQQFKDKCGARAILIDPGVVEIGDRYAEPSDTSLYAEIMRDAEDLA